MESLKKLDIAIYSNPYYFGLLMIIEFIIFLVIVYRYNPYYDPNKPGDYPALTQFIVLIVGFIYAMLFIFLKEKLINNDMLDLGMKNPTEFEFTKRIVFTLLFFIVFILITVSLIWTFSHLSMVSSIILFTLIALIVIVIIAIIYIFAEKLIEKIFPTHGFFSFMKNFILFIPCLLIRFIDYIKYEYRITTKPIWILIITEIILILLWFIIPLLFKYYFNRDGSKLLDGPVYLNKKNDIGNFENLHMPNLKDGKFLYHYSLSAWFTINPQPPNTSSAYTKYTSLLNYGNKPNVQYHGEKNSLRVITVLKENTAEVELFETKNIQYQKWNNIVINYDGGDMDVFLNGELVGSKPGIAPYMSYENVSVGENNGIHGGICNVKYYNHILSNKDIKLTYKMLRDKDVPNV